MAGRFTRVSSILMSGAASRTKPFTAIEAPGPAFGPLAAPDCRTMLPLALATLVTASRVPVKAISAVVGSPGAAAGNAANLLKSLFETSRAAATKLAMLVTLLFGPNRMPLGLISQMLPPVAVLPPPVSVPWMLDGVLPPTRFSTAKAALKPACAVNDTVLPLAMLKLFQLMMEAASPTRTCSTLSLPPAPAITFWAGSPTTMLVKPPLPLPFGE